VSIPPFGFGVRSMTMPAQIEALRRLRGHLVSRRPTQPELSHRKPILLTERDKEILVAVYTHGVLTTELIEFCFFPAGDAGRQAPCTRAYDRVRSLWLWGLLDRIELPVARALGGSRPYLYTLGPRGVAIVSAQLGEGTTPVQRRRLDRVDDVFVEHDLNVAALWANLKAITRTTCVAEARWTAERDLRGQHFRVRDPQRAGRWLPFLPDGYVELIYASGRVQPIVVEIDMGTLTIARYRAKIRGFEAFLSQGLFERHFRRPSFEVAILTTSRRRLEHLTAATRRELADDEERWPGYQFASFDVLRPSTFLDVDWLGADGQEYSLFYSDAWDGPCGRVEPA
jgi:Replication-relaxation